MYNKRIPHHLQLAILLMSSLFFSGSSQALEIRSFDASKHLRFLNFPSNPSHNPDFIHASHDFSGVGWITSNTRRQLTMVSPKHFVGAYHFRPPIGSTLCFLSSDGVIKNATITSITSVLNTDGSGSDLCIGTIDKAFTEGDNVAFHPYLNLDSESDYRSQDLIVLGRTARGGRAIINSINNAPNSSINRSRALNFTYLAAEGGDDDCFFQAGDSGSPAFVNQDGVAAIVGTHSLISRLRSGNSLNYSNFVPFYIDELNLIMENDGYRMTEAIPASTSLSLTQTESFPTTRVGDSITLQINLKNTGPIVENSNNVNTAENIRLSTTFPTDASFTSVSGAGWFNEPNLASNISNCRRAKIPPGESVPLSITFTPTSPGVQSYTFTYSSDQSSSVSQTFSINVTPTLSTNLMPTFSNWSNGLTDTTASGDDDQDGIPNLLEYAFGGDPTTSSQQSADNSIPLLPAFSGTKNSSSVSYIRRKDHAERAINYQLTSSTSLLDDGFLDASSLITNTDISPINDELELVTNTMSSPGSTRFFRVEISLGEVALGE